MPGVCPDLKRFLLISLLGLIATVVGCLPTDGCYEWGYALGALNGELDLLSQTVPIEAGLTDPTLTEDQRTKLGLVIQARDYAEQVVGLRVGGSYRNFVNLHGGQLAWNLSASRKDAIEAYVWEIPVAGAMPFLGFFHQDQALAERDWLVEQGYDTLIYKVDAFSTLGLLPDPLTSALLERSIPSLADTVMHELLHNTVWHPLDTTFNESLASFVGRTASMEFLERQYGSDSPVLQKARDENEDEDRLNTFLSELRASLEELYGSNLSSEEKIAQRESRFQAGRERFLAEVQPLMHQPEAYAAYGTLRYNNAFLLVNVRYNSDLSVFGQVYDMTGHDWKQSLALFTQAAQAQDPVAFLKNLLPPQP